MTHGRLRARAASLFFGGIVTVSDLLPPRVRYGYVHPLTARLMRRPLPAVRGTHRRADAIPTAPSREPALVTAALVADSLDVGGIGSVIEMLANTLAQHGVRPVVICHGDGARAQRLREGGIDVRAVDHHADPGALFADIDVVELHSAPRYLEILALESDLPVVTAMHNTEIHFTRRRWRDFESIMRRSAAGVAVSETVREFHAHHLPRDLRARLEVVPNGAASAPLSGPEERATARSALAEVIGANLEDDFVVVCLARYDSQKNVAGTIASVVHAMDLDELSRLRFVYAGAPSDWAELHRADAIRRESRHSGRVHLLGNSDSEALLAAADAFLLNSFFEGWPVAATEAAAVGLPVILSDVGGARELVAADPSRSQVVSNAVGEAASVSDRRVRAARRRSRRQGNREELSAALCTVVGSGLATARPAPSSSAISVDAMASGHARILRTAATRAPSDAP